MIIIIIIMLAFFLFILIGFFYYWSVRTYDYWSRLNVPFVPPSRALFGNLDVFAAKRENYTETLNRLYGRLDGQPYGGYFEMRDPVLMIRSPNLIGLIAIKFFDHFADREVPMLYTPDTKSLNPLSVNLFALKGERWRDLRQKLSPSFTANKLKHMFVSVKTCTNVLIGLIKSDEPIEIKALAMNYVIDVVGICAMGVDCSSMAETERSIFVRMAKRTFVESDYTLKFILQTLHPKLPKLLRVPDIPKEVTGFFSNVVCDIVNRREEKTEEIRKDFLQVLIDIKNDQDDTSRNVTKLSRTFDIIDVCANAFAFFGGGFETTASTIAYCLYELCFRPDVQQTARNEVNNVKATNGRNLTMDSLRELHYLDAIISETLRMYPPVPALFRVCTKDYKLPDSDTIIRKGTKIVIPIQAIHTDPDIFNDPNNFDPDRFLNKNTSKIPAYSYIPFGEGPRYCIGIRFAKLVLSYALAEILSNYLVFPTDRTERPIEFSKGVPLLSPKNGIWIKMRKIR